MDLQNNASFSSYASEESGVLLLYLVVREH